MELPSSSSSSSAYPRPPAAHAITDDERSRNWSGKPGVGYRPPEGRWKDGLCACANQVTPSGAIALCLPCLGLAVLAQRLGWSGDRRPCPCQRAFLPPDSPGNMQRHYQRTLLRFASATIVVAFWLLAMLGDQFAASREGKAKGRLQWYDYLLIAAIALFVLEFVMFLAHLRSRARARLRLPPFCCDTGDSEGSSRDPRTARRLAFVGDACVSLICPVLVMAQLLRHMFDFRGPFDSRWPLRESDAEMLV